MVEPTLGTNHAGDATPSLGRTLVPVLGDLGLGSRALRAALAANAAIPGQHLSALISMGYIFGFRKDNAIFFNGLGQNHPDHVSPKRLCH
jgi:hypothetical protein